MPGEVEVNAAGQMDQCKSCCRMNMAHYSMLQLDFMNIKSGSVCVFVCVWA